MNEQEPQVPRSVVDREQALAGLPEDVREQVESQDEAAAYEAAYDQYARAVELNENAALKGARDRITTIEQTTGVRLDQKAVARTLEDALGKAGIPSTELLAKSEKDMDQDTPPSPEHHEGWVKGRIGKTLAEHGADSAVAKERAAEIYERGHQLQDKQQNGPTGVERLDRWRTDRLQAAKMNGRRLLQPVSRGLDKPLRESFWDADRRTTNFLKSGKGGAIRKTVFGLGRFVGEGLWLGTRGVAKLTRGGYRLLKSFRD